MNERLAEDNEKQSSHVQLFVDHLRNLGEQSTEELAVAASSRCQPQPERDDSGRQSTVQCHPESGSLSRLAKVRD